MAKAERACKEALQRGAQKSKDIESFLGFLAGKSCKIATLKEINEAASAGWAGQIE